MNYKIKRILLSLCLVLTMMVGTKLDVGAAEDLEVLVRSTGSANAGDNVSTQFFLNNNPGVTTIPLTLAYDSNVLEYTGAVWLSSLASNSSNVTMVSNVENGAESCVNISAVCLDGYSESGENIVTVNFTAKQSFSSMPVTASIRDGITDLNGDEIAATVVVDRTSDPGTGSESDSGSASNSEGSSQGNSESSSQGNSENSSQGNSENSSQSGGSTNSENSSQSGGSTNSESSSQNGGSTNSESSSQSSGGSDTDYGDDEDPWGTELLDDEDDGDDSDDGSGDDSDGDKKGSGSSGGSGGGKDGYDSTFKTGAVDAKIIFAVIAALLVAGAGGSMYYLRRKKI